MWRVAYMGGCRLKQQGSGCSAIWRLFGQTLDHWGRVYVRGPCWSWIRLRWWNRRPWNGSKWLPWLQWWRRPSESAGAEEEKKRFESHHFHNRLDASLTLQNMQQWGMFGVFIHFLLSLILVVDMDIHIIPSEDYPTATLRSPRSVILWRTARSGQNSVSVAVQIEHRQTPK